MQEKMRLSIDLSVEPFAKLLEGVGLAADPTRALSVGDLNDEQITVVTKIWAEAVAKRCGVTIASY